MVDRRPLTTCPVTIIVIPAAIDRTNSGLIGDQLRAACTPQAIVVADMTGTTWCDSRGMHELASAHSRARELGGELRIAGPRGPRLRVWELLGAGKVLAIYPTLAAATATPRNRDLGAVNDSSAGPGIRSRRSYAAGGHVRMTSDCGGSARN